MPDLWWGMLIRLRHYLGEVLQDASVFVGLPQNS